MARTGQKEDNNGKKPRRGHNEGSIGRATDGRWWARMTLPNGKRKAFYGRTREEVKDQLLDALKNKKDGRPVISTKQTVAQFLAQWLEAAEPTIKATTFIRYKEMVNKHTLPSIGKVKLAQLTPQHLHQLYAKKLGEGLSPTTVAQQHRILHRAFSQALRWGLVATNVTEAVDPPRKRRIEMKTLSPDQAKTLLEAAKGDRFEALYVLALSTGLRQGELLGMRWKDIDLENCCLQVVATLQRTRNGLALSAPKTAHARRKVILTDFAVSALRRHRISQAEERLKAGALWEDSGLTFPNETGKPMDAGNLLYRSFKPLLAKAGLPKIRFHDLRHSAATLLMSKGIHPKIVSEILGHSQISITLDLYSHVVPTMQQEAKEAMEAILQG